MQDERDFLMRFTFPRLRELAAQRDVAVTELDLRWGITQEEAQSGNVVDICLREIENSIPFFIGIIGNRYGWIPKREEISAETLDRFKQVNGYLERRLSVTEMEMQFGVLEREEDMHAYFYIKDNKEDSLHPECEDEPDDVKEKLERLIAKVEGSRYPSSTYSSKEDLSSQVETAFVNLLELLFPLAESSAEARSQLAQRSFKNRLCQLYIGSDVHFKALDKWLSDINQRVLIVKGESGIGKSALIANWLNEKKSDCFDYRIVAHFVGNGGCEGTKEYVEESVCKEICRVYGLNPANKSLAAVFAEISSCSSTPLLLVIDAVNQLTDVDDTKLLNWIPIPPENVKVLFSTLPEDRTMEVFSWRGYPVYTLSSISVEQRKAFAIKYLRQYAKTLSDSQLRRIISSSICGNSYILKTVLEELVNYGQFETLDEKIDSLISKKDADNFFDDYLLSYEKIFEAHELGFIPKVLSLIAVSKYGLSEDEILSVTGIKPLYWSQFYCSFKNNFIVKNGLVSFSSEQIRSAVFRRYLVGNSGWETECRGQLIAWFEVRGGNRAWDELPGHYSSMSRLDKLFDILSDGSCLMRYLDRDRQVLWKYWNTLLESDGYSLNVYLKTTDADFEQDCSIARFVAEFSGDIDCALRYMERARRFVTEENLVDYLRTMGDVMVEDESYVGYANRYFRKAVQVLMDQTVHPNSDIAYCTLQIAKSNDLEGALIEKTISDIEDTCDFETEPSTFFADFAHDMEMVLKDLLASKEIDQNVLDKYGWSKEQTIQKLIQAGLLEENIMEPSEGEYESDIECEQSDIIQYFEGMDCRIPEYKYDFEARLYGEELQKAYFEEAIRLYIADGVPEKSPEIGRCYASLSQILWLSEHPESALPYLDKAYDVFTKLKTDKCSEIIEILRSRAKIFVQTLFDSSDDIVFTEGGERVTNHVINSLYDRILDISGFVYGKNSMKCASVYEEYGDFYDSVMDFKNEKECYAAALDIYHLLGLEKEEKDTREWIDNYINRRIKSS